MPKKIASTEERTEAAEVHPIGSAVQSALIFLGWPALVALVGTLIFFPTNAHSDAYASGSWLLVFGAVDLGLMGLLAVGLALSLRKSA
jgi:hypothetical protein